MGNSGSKTWHFRFDKVTKNLVRLKKTANEIEEPAFLAIITATAGMAWQREDKVLVIPIDCLAP